MQLKEYKTYIADNQYPGIFEVRTVDGGFNIFHQQSDSYYTSKRSNMTKLFKSETAAFNKLRELGVTSVVVKL